MIRRALASAAALAALSLSLPAVAQSAAPPPARIVLLGTKGGPPPEGGRSQPATLFEVGGRQYLIDAGENVGQQLIRAGSAPPRVEATFLTHLHWDHTLGLDYLMATGWMMGRTRSMAVWGPPGTREFVSRTVKAVELGEDIFRPQAPGRPKLASLYPSREVTLSGPRVLLDEGGVKVSAVPTSHFAHLRAPRHAYGDDAAYAYRFDTPQGSVVFTGDTGPSPALAQFARGADVLVAEVTDLPSMRVALQQAGSTGKTLDLLMEHMEYQHLTAAALGALARDAGVKKLVLTHYVTGRNFRAEDLVAPLSAVFKGEIVVGKDLTVVPFAR